MTFEIFVRLVKNYGTDNHHQFSDSFIRLHEFYELVSLFNYVINIVLIRWISMVGSLIIDGQFSALVSTLLIMGKSIYLYLSDSHKHTMSLIYVSSLFQSSLSISNV